VNVLPLTLLLFAVTYPWRAVPLLVPGLERLPPTALQYLRLVAPAILSALAAVNTTLLKDEAGHVSFHVGLEWLAVAACIGVVAWRRNLLLGLAAAVAIAALGRAAGLG
jgi:branched-subunit amino acid transport protein